MPGKFSGIDIGAIAPKRIYVLIDEIKGTALVSLIKLIDFGVANWRIAQTFN